MVLHVWGNEIISDCADDCNIVVRVIFLFCSESEYCNGKCDYTVMSRNPNPTHCLSLAAAAVNVNCRFGSYKEILYCFENFEGILKLY